jgi:two-component system chemotaxis sensor kinase CheA
MVNNVNKQNQRLRELKEEAEAASLALKEERDTIAAMKDGIKIGLFFMDSNFIIQKEYSRALETVLAVKKLAGRKFTDMLSGSIKQKEKANLIEYFVLLFKRSLTTGHSLDKKMIEDLNPLREIDYIDPETKEEKNLRCSFTPVDRGEGRLYILGTIQDYTAEKQMERKVAAEEQDRQEELRSLFEVIQADPKVFNGFLESIDSSWDRINGFLDDTQGSPADILAGIGRTAEALRVKAAELGLETFGAKLKGLTDLVKKTDPASSEGLFEIRKTVRRLMKEKDKFQEILKKIQSFSAWGIRKL